MKTSKSSFTPEDLVTLRSAVASSLIDFLVMFTQEKGPDEILLGSGTLVSIDKTKAILTADHVLQKIKQSSGNVRLLFPTRFDNPQRSGPKSSTVIPMKYLEKRTIGRGSQEDSGPDLGVLVLPDPIASRFVPSTKTFYNLSMRCRKAMRPPRAIDTGLWVLAGAPEELTEKTFNSGSAFAKVKKQGAILGLGCVTREYIQDGFDYLEFLADYNAHYEGPRRFGGCSGGGLWHLLLEKDAAGEIIIKEKTLSGVAFYESELKHGKRIVKCHGRKSIYQRVSGGMP